MYQITYFCKGNLVNDFKLAIKENKAHDIDYLSELYMKNLKMSQELTEYPDNSIPENHSLENPSLHNKGTENQMLQNRGAENQMLQNKFPETQIPENKKDA